MALLIMPSVVRFIPFLGHQKDDSYLFSFECLQYQYQMKDYDTLRVEYTLQYTKNYQILFTNQFHYLKSNFFSDCFANFRKIILFQIFFLVTAEIFTTQQLEILQFNYRFFKFINSIIIILWFYNEIHITRIIQSEIYKIKYQSRTMQNSSEKSISAINIEAKQIPFQDNEMNTMRKYRIPSQTTQLSASNKKKSKSKNSISKQTLKRFERSDKNKNTQIKIPFTKPFLPPSHKKESKDVKQYQKIIEELRQQNQELRRQIIQLKVNDFYRFDQSKVRDLITYAENFRSQNRDLKKKIQQSQVVRDFLQRSNQKLKEQCEHLIKSLMNLKMDSSSVNTRSHRVSQQDPNQSFKKYKYSRTDFKSPVNSTRKREPTAHQFLIASNTGDSQLNPQNLFKVDLSNQFKENQLSKISSLGSFGGMEKQLGQSIYYKNSRTQT